ncbi:MAG TPA: MazG family protein [Propioniciclava sp.]|jgi:XTP/dITP diphosphohydrolase|uniref:MazG family protein n=1 Tax=Propioniciclava sp. TaxID=2038686 RepID=UPI002CCEF03F|nr:MazG family protein [Propioniciclava sp.]HRL49834.1 MazG family protein [Propioniciclava sp.]HRL79679.1 MazG family protein [Propioniciclava sp.]
MSDRHPELERLVAVMARLRRDCPWDAEQTHRSLVTYLIEETAEVVEAIEEGEDPHLVEELGDLLLQVLFHAQIASDEGRFDVEDVARGIADKLVQRHPHVFAAGEVPGDLDATWEARKRAEKGRTSALEGIPPLNALARSMKVIRRTRKLAVPLELPRQPISAEATGAGILELVARAEASGIDADQAVRDAVRALEQAVTEAEGAQSASRGDGAA